MVFKCTNGLVLPYLSQILSTRSQVHRYNTMAIYMEMPLCYLHRDATAVFKCTNGLVIPYLSQILSTHSQVDRYNT